MIIYHFFIYFMKFILFSYFHRWNTGEPNNLGGEKCAEIYNNGNWNNAQCTSLKPFVCAYEPGK